MPDNKMKLSLYLITQLIFIGLATSLTGCKKDNTPIVNGRSSSGKILRYDLTVNDYDVIPVTTLSMSYSQDDQIINMYEKNGSSLISYSLNYTGGKLTRVQANNLGVQKVTYDAVTGKPARVDYTTLTDTGKLVLQYNASGKLAGVLDSLKQPLKLPLKYQYIFTYDSDGNNVVQITKNQLDLQNRPTLQQNSYYTFDDKKNPFISLPALQNTLKLPGSYGALVNRNNVIKTRIVGFVFSPGGPDGGSTPVLTPVDTYESSRSYEYNDKGLPQKATETFNDIQYNYKGSRIFTYDY
jgi:hypothetical protein